VQQAKEKAGDLAQQARDQIVSQLTTQKDQVAGTLDTMALAFMQTGQQLRDQGQGAVSNCVEQVAGIGDQLSSYLRQRDINQLVGEVEDFGRRQPALFLGTAFAIGFFAVRFLKSSTPSVGDGMVGQGDAGGGASVYDSAPYETLTSGTSEYGTTGYGGGAYGTAGSGGAGYGTIDTASTGYGSSGYGASTYAGAGATSTDTVSTGSAPLPTPLSETALAPTDSDDEGSYQAVTGSEVP